MKKQRIAFVIGCVLTGSVLYPSSGSLSVNRRWLDAGDGNVPGGRRFSAAGRKNFR